jgi:hypothetical protein
MKNLAILLILGLTLCGCHKSGTNSAIKLEPPDFKINVSLSDEAAEKLKSLKETVKVVAYFSGDPNNSLWAKIHTTEQGRIDIARSEIEMDGPGIADFAKTKFSPMRVDELANPDYRVLINVISGRRSSASNLLDCDTAGGKISTMQKKVFEVYCRLIEEPRPFMPTPSP